MDCTDVQLPESHSIKREDRDVWKCRSYLMHLPCANLYLVAGGEEDVHTIEMLQI